MHLRDLPQDILLDIIEYLRPNDILALRQTCRALETATRVRTVWFSALARYSQQSSLPIPGIREHDLFALSSADLERLTLRALRYYSNWLSPRPQYYRSVHIRPSRSVQRIRGARNLAIVFLPAHTLTLTLYDDTSRDERYSFELWRVANNSEAGFVDALPVEGIIGYAVNTVADCSSTVTITRRAPNNQGLTLQCITDVYAIDLPPVEGRSCFRFLRHFDGYRNTIGLHGSRLVATDAEQDVRLVNVDTGVLEYVLKAPVMLNDPTLRFAERQCLDAVVLDGFVLSFCKQYILLYHIPSARHDAFDDTGAPSNVPGLDSVATYKWRWRIDTLIAKSRRSPQRLTRLSRAGSRGAKSSTPPLIDILIRFDTWYPWPVNILHHFVLAPNPAYCADALNLADPATLPYLLSETDGPFMVQSIPSPLRIFTPSDVVLGSYGTALWIDASTDVTTPSQAGDHGQRVAGNVLTRTPLPQERVRPGEGPQDDNVSPGPVNTASRSSSCLLPDSTELGRVADPPAAGSIVSVFHIQESDEKWNRVAVDEEEGRIALGHVDGTVSVYSYVPT